jgi:hypothetical protein
LRVAFGEWRRRFAFEWREARVRNIRGDFRDVKQQAHRGRDGE